MARSKKQIWYFDLEKIERDGEPLNVTELKVKERLAHDPREQLELQLMLHEALKQLTPKQRQVITSQLTGATLTEMARELHVSVPTIHEIVAAAHRRLRMICQQEGCSR